MKSMRWSLPFILIFIILGFSCRQEADRRSSSESSSAAAGKEASGSSALSDSVARLFNPDSALALVGAQCAFGPRVPGTEAHRKCGDFLAERLRRCGGDVVVQEFRARAYDGKVLQGRNIIGRFSPEKKSRLMLAAHWDSRHVADHDPDPAKRNQPVMGANDGASGVGVLLELARILQRVQPGVGVDIVFFDLEDYGPPESSGIEAMNEHWGLGSQHWSRNPHEYNYRPRFCILLDMVGAPGAVFPHEGFSMQYAPDVVRKTWNIAQDLGYGDYFVNRPGTYINDDHYFINVIARIPAIDIIHLDPNSPNGSFFEYWHTTGDTFEKIDRETLRAVGKVLAYTVLSV